MNQNSQEWDWNFWEINLKIISVSWQLKLQLQDWEATWFCTADHCQWKMMGVGQWERNWKISHNWPRTETGPQTCLLHKVKTSVNLSGNYYASLRSMVIKALWHNENKQSKVSWCDIAWRKCFTWWCHETMPRRHQWWLVHFDGNHISDHMTWLHNVWCRRWRKLLASASCACSFVQIDNKEVEKNNEKKDNKKTMGSLVPRHSQDCGQCHVDVNNLKIWKWHNNGF